MKKRPLFIIYFLMACIKINAQQVVKNNKYKIVTVEKKATQSWPLTVSWYSPVWLHSGLGVQTEYILRTREKKINRPRILFFAGVKKRDNYQNKSRSLIIQPGLFFYNQKQFHTGMMAHVQAKYRWTRYKGLTAELGVGAGALWTVYAGKTYVIKNDGEIKERSLAGRRYFMPTLSFGTGWDFAKKSKNKNAGALSFEFVLGTPMPMGSSIGLLSYWQLGYRFKLNSFTKNMNAIWAKK